MKRFLAPTRLLRLLLALGPMALLLAASPALAQPAYRLVVRYAEAPPTGVQRLAKTLQTYAAETRKDEPWTRVEVLSELGRPNRMVVIERWENMDGAQEARLNARVDGLVAGQTVAPVDHRRNDALTLPIFERPPASSFHVVMHLDVVPDGSATAARALSEQRAAVLAAPGAISFEASTQSNRPNHFAVYEVWRSRAAYEAYIATAPAQDLRKQLTPIKGAPFDDRFYTAAATLK